MGDNRAAEILEALLAELGEALDLAESEPGAEPDPFLCYLRETVEDARATWVRIRLGIAA